MCIKKQSREQISVDYTKRHISLEMWNRLTRHRLNELFPIGLPIRQLESLMNERYEQLGEEDANRNIEYAQTLTDYAQ